MQPHKKRSSPVKSLLKPGPRPKPNKRSRPGSRIIHTTTTIIAINKRTILTLHCEKIPQVQRRALSCEPFVVTRDMAGRGETKNKTCCLFVCSHHLFFFFFFFWPFFAVPGPVDEHSQLLGNGTNKTNGITNSGSQGYGAAATGAHGQMHDSLSSLYLRGKAAIARLFNSDPCPDHPADEESHDQAFPTQLNPVVATKKSSKLGVFSGVFVPCVLSIWGIILFLRFGFIIGQAGVLGTMAMFIVGYMINIFTTMSLSAISTNGTVRGKQRD